MERESRTDLEHTGERQTDPKPANEGTPSSAALTEFRALPNVDLREVIQIDSPIMDSKFQESLNVLLAHVKISPCTVNL